MRSNSSNKESILAISFLLLLLFLFSRNIVFVYAATGFILVCLLSDTVSAFFDVAWKKLTQVLGLVSSTIILTVIFFCIIFPWAMMLKLFGKKSMLLNNSNIQTTFISNNKLITAKDLQNPF